MRREKREFGLGGEGGRDFERGGDMSPLWGFCWFFWGGYFFYVSSILVMLYVVRSRIYKLLTSRLKKDKIKSNWAYFCTFTLENHAQVTG